MEYYMYIIHIGVIAPDQARSCNCVKCNKYYDAGCKNWFHSFNYRQQAHRGPGILQNIKQINICRAHALRDKLS